MQIRTKNFFIALAIIFAVVNAGLLIYVYSKGGIFAREFYAVHLSNGQVYVGEMANVNSETVKLKNVYYLEAPNTADLDGKLKKMPLQISGKQYDLVKRGSGTLLPTDGVLNINRSTVLYWEKLDPSSDIVSAIEN